MPTPELVRAYYGQELQSSADLKTSACCDADAVPARLKPLLAKVHPEVTARYYGCGLVVPTLLEGCTVLDLGCGTGRDVYLLAQLVGPTGRVVGVDMTPEQLAVARAHQAYHAEQFGYDVVTFVDGSIEALEALDLAEASVDVVVSNCVLNLSTAKDLVLRGVKRLLKPGGEFYFSDVYCDRRLDTAVRNDPVLWGECLGGALYWRDFLRLAREAGFPDPRLVSDRVLAITEPTLAPLVAGARFFSATWRLFSLPGLEDACEDYGDAVRYRGTIDGDPEACVLDAHHRFSTGETVPVCRNTLLMVSQTRLASHFDCLPAGTHHRGLFAGCGDALPFRSASPEEPCCGPAVATPQTTGQPSGSGCC